MLSGELSVPAAQTYLAIAIKSPHVFFTLNVLPVAPKFIIAGFVYVSVFLIVPSD
jgi:hypothetical protein